MIIDEKVLKREEKAVFRLRSLYQGLGYTRYKMSRFEEYDLYVRNKDFLVSDNVITFTDTNGKLLALKPDVTLSIIKNSQDKPCSVQKVYYNENVYRVTKSTGAYGEISQTGLECIGDLKPEHICEVTLLAARSLEAISDDYVLDISHMGFVSGLLNRYGLSEETKAQILPYIKEKNSHDLRLLGDLPQDLIDSLSIVVNSYGKLADVLPDLEAIAVGDEMNVALDELKNILAVLDAEGISDKINVDFSIVNDMNYYSGIVFQGFIPGIPTSVLSGGSYDNLMKKLGKSTNGIGFAVYLNLLERLDDIQPEAVRDTDKVMLNVALPKGRLGDSVYEMFEKAGFECPSFKDKGRKLVFENEEVGIRYFWVKPSDVAIYVERGAADIGVAGKDILLEHNPDVHELLDLNVGICRMAVAAMKDFTDDTEKTLRVATEFVNITRDYYASKGRDIDIIKLNGSIELAPILGLSDVIVDIVESGNTLRANNLEPIEDILPISARLIANKSAFEFKTRKIEEVMTGLAAQVKEKN